MTKEKLIADLPEYGPFKFEKLDAKKWRVLYPSSMQGILNRPDSWSGGMYTVEFGPVLAKRLNPEFKRIANRFQKIEAIEVPEKISGLGLEKHDSGYLIVYGPALRIYRQMTGLKSSRAPHLKETKEIYGDCLIFRAEVAQAAIDKLIACEGEVEQFLNREPPAIEGLDTYINSEGNLCISGELLIQMYWSRSFSVSYPRPNRHAEIEVKNRASEENTIAAIKEALFNLNNIAKSKEAQKEKRVFELFVARHQEELNAAGVEISVDLPWVTFKAPYIGSMGKIYMDAGWTWLPYQKRWCILITERPQDFDLLGWIMLLYEQVATRALVER